LRKSLPLRFSRLARLTVPFPLLLLGAAGLGYALMAPYLGFYWDDWQILYIQKLAGPAGFWSYFAYDRPLSAWTYLTAAKLLGASPLPWHLFSLAMRYVTGLGFWWTLSGIWPERKSLAGWSALLFMVFPVFAQQPMSAVYSQHWMCYAMVTFSLGTMVWAQRRQDPEHWLHPLSRALAALALFTTDYFAGMELFRVLLLFVLAPRGGTLRKRFLWGLRQWLPYLGIFVVYLAWRFFLAEYPQGRIPNQPFLLLEFLKTPFPVLVRLATYVLQDLAYMFVTGWARWLPPEALDLADRFNVFALAAAAAAGLVCAWQLARREEDCPGSPAQPFLLGICAILIGLLPTWLTNRQLIVGLYSDRFGLTVLPGAALALAGLVFWITPRRLAQNALLGLLFAAALNFNLRNANDYRWTWINQQRFFWQLAWRAPGLQPGTALVADGEVMSRSSTYNTSFALNLLYGTDAPDANYQPELWFFSLGRLFRDNMPLYLSGTDLSARIRNMEFSAPSANGIAVDYRPGVSNCLHILRAEDGGDEMLPAYSRLAAGSANLGRINPSGQTPEYREKIFGREPEHRWCYFYEKAELARQMGEWNTVLELAGQAAAQGYNPLRSESSTAMEWRVFIEGYARAGQWDLAAQLTRQALERQPEYLPMMCALWAQPAQQSEPGAALRQELACPAVKP
jgi:hypothetical protein